MSRMRVDQTLALDQAAKAEDNSSASSAADGETKDIPLDSKEVNVLYSTNSEEQDGVKQADAMTRSWSKGSLYTIYLFFWLTYCTNAFQSSITGNLAPYITSAFAEHSLIPVIGIVSSVMSAAAYLIIAKILNIWDRSYGYLGMAALATLGLILSAACTNIASYCAAQVFYNIGFIGIIFSVDVLTADTSQLKNRGLAYAFTSSPYIITAYSGPVMAAKFYENNWRWAYGAFAIILPAVSIPMFLFLQKQKRQAKAAGLIVKSDSGRTFWESTKYYIIEFDVIGVFLITAGMVIFLLPFAIASTYASSFASPEIIVMIVIGFLCIIAFAFYERYFSPKPFVPWHLLIDRTVLGSCILDFSWQIAYYCWASYFTSYLQVVYNLNITTAGYIASIYDVVATLCMIPVGYLIRKTGYFKWVVLVGVPMYTLGEGLMIYFRKPGNSIGYIVFTQVLIAIAGSSFTLIEQVGVLAAGSHNDAAALLALLGLFGYWGGSVGGAISGAIWTNTLPQALQQYLPADTVDLWEEIYEDLDTQLSYPIGDPTRIAIQEAYAVAQTRMLIAGTAIMGLTLASVILIKNINVSKISQVRGVLW
ncbi:MFS general substrate transporter [Meredithblackwellia eburnea MCA 4105]